MAGGIVLNIEGKLKFAAKLKQKGALMSKEVARAINSATVLLHSAVVRAIQKKPKTGRIYIRGNDIKHRASAPGEAPATDTGNLIRNIVIDIRKENGQVVGFVISNAKYSAALEFGTKHMAPRPFMRPSYEQLLPRMRKMIADAIRKANSK